MFHLFDNVYTEHEKWYSIQYNHAIMGATEMPHPAARLAKVDLSPIPSFEKQLADHYEGSEDKFWERMLSAKKDEKFIIFLDETLLFRFKITYWKSILKNPSPENLYQLYQYDILDNKLKRYLYVGSGFNMLSAWEQPDPVLFDEFKKNIESIEASQALKEMDKSRVGFELLLANNFLGSKYRSAFLERLKALSWRAWFDDVEILRSEIINSFYDIKRILPNSALAFPDVKLIEHYIMAEPQLSWILDPEFSSRNIDYVKKTYSKDVFLDLSRKVLNCIDGKDPSATRPEEHILPTEHVFEDRYEELLQKNINKKFGCLFVGDQLKNKANQLLPLLVYEKVREKKISDLAFLELN